jgi:membrane-associated protease RseP (regulator of RpoE activity)
MRLWPFGRRPPPAAPPPGDLLLAEAVLRRNVEDLLAVRERQVHGPVVTFRGALTTAPARALDILRERFRPFGYTPFLKPDRLGVAVQAWPLADTRVPERIGVNVLLFVLTCLSTLMAGWFFSGSPTFDALRTAGPVAQLVVGVPFAATLLAILGTHEFGHYFTARHHDAPVSLPYFIPAPPPIFLFGTLGAIIRMRAPARDRNALFDIAAAGPLAGLAVAVPALLLGLEWSRVVPRTGEHVMFGSSLAMDWLIRLRFGDLPAGTMLSTHPVADAAWVGFLVTALNLFPVGQLDGGRIAYALFGRRHRLVGILTFLSLLVLFVWTGSPNWVFWAALIFFLVGFTHQPPLDDLTPLSPGRRVVGAGCLVLLVLLVPPVPLSFG